MSPSSSSHPVSGLAEAGAIGLPQAVSACGVLVVDSHDYIVAATPEAAAQLQLKAERLSGTALDTLPAPLATLIRSTASADGSRFDQPVALQTRGGGTLLNVTVIPIPARDERIVLLRPAIPASLPEQNLQRLDRLANLGSLSAAMAHEIKNGMVAIKTYIELLLQKGQEQELAEVVKRELKRIDAMVGQMLSFGAPVRAAPSEPVQVHALLDHSLRLIEHRFGSKLISVVRRYEARPDTVRGDEYQLQQALMNLLLNAVEAMGAHGVLTVSTETLRARPGGRQLRIHIQDTGEGIQPENLPRLFEPFFTTKKHGTGLGLAICRRILGEHGGTVSAQSKVSRGSTFSLSLPATGHA